MNIQQKQDDIQLNPEQQKRLRAFGFINNETTYHMQDLKSLEYLMDQGFQKNEYLMADFLYRVMIKLGFLVQELETRGLRFTNLKLGKIYIYAKDKFEDQPFLKLSDHVESNDSPFEKYYKLIRQLRYSVYGNLARQHYPNQSLINFHFYLQRYYLTDEQGQQSIYNQNTVQVYKIKKHSYLNDNSEQIIMKMIQENNPEYFYREIKILEKLNSQNLACLFYYTRGADFTLLFVKFYGLTLEQFEISTTDTFNKIMIQILTATKELHNLNIIHRELRPQNIMFDSEDPPNCVLIEFDQSKDNSTWTENINSSLYEGTPDYQPSEAGAQYLCIKPVMTVGNQVQYFLNYAHFYTGKD